jgi:hypothetical protein
MNNHRDHKGHGGGRAVGFRARDRIGVAPSVLFVSFVVEGLAAAGPSGAVR